MQLRYFPYFFLFFIFSLYSVNTSAADYYIATTGSDATGDGSSGNPYLTLAKVFSTHDLGTGDIIYIAAGTYTEKAITVGADDEGFTIQGVSSATTIFDSDQSARWLYLGNSANDNITIKNLTIKDYATSGSTDGGAIYLVSGANNFSVENVIFNNCDAGGDGAVYVEANTISFTNCTFFNCNAGGKGGAICSNSSACTITVTKCIFYSNSGTYGAAIEADGTSSTLNITNSLFYENYSSTDGVIGWDYSSSATLINCTVVDNTSAGTGGIIGWTSTTSTLKNVIAYNNTTYDIRELDGTLNLTNCSYTGAGTIVITGSNTSPQTGDPTFTNAASDDYTLQTGSNCKNAGTATGAPSDDILGFTRDGSPDIGCYEFIAAYTWEGDDGSTPTDWKTAENWNSGIIPTTSINAIIPTGLSNYPNIDEADAVCATLTVQSGGTVTVSSGKLTVTALQLDNGGTISVGGGELESSGKFDWDGELSMTNGTLDINNEIELSSTMTETISGGTIECSGIWDGASDDGGFTPTGGTVVFDGTTSTTIDLFSSANFYHLTLNKSSNGVDATSNLAISGDFTITDGTFDVETYTITVTGASSIADGETLLINTGTFDGNGTFTSNTSGIVDFDGAGKISLSGVVSSLGTLDAAAGTVEYDAAGSQNVLADDYYNLEIDGSGTKTSQGTITVAGTMTVTAGTYDVATTTNTVTGTTSIVDGQTLTIGTGTFNADGTFTANTSGVVDFSSAGKLILSSTVTSLGVLDNATGTVEYDGGQNILVDNYYSLEIDGASTLAGAIDVDGNLILTSGSLDVSGSHYAISIAGDFVRASGATFTCQQGTVTFDGSATQKVNVTTAGGSTPTDSDITFYNVIFDGTDVKIYYNKTNDRSLNFTDFTINNTKSAEIIGN